MSNRTPLRLAALSLFALVASCGGPPKRTAALDQGRQAVIAKTHAVVGRAIELDPLRHETVTIEPFRLRATEEPPVSFEVKTDVDGAFNAQDIPFDPPYALKVTVPHTDLTYRTLVAAPDGSPVYITPLTTLVAAHADWALQKSPIDVQTAVSAAGKSIADHFQISSPLQTAPSIFSETNPPNLQTLQTAEGRLALISYALNRLSIRLDQEEKDFGRIPGASTLTLARLTHSLSLDLAADGSIDGVGPNGDKVLPKISTSSRQILHLAFANALRDQAFTLLKLHDTESNPLCELARDIATSSSETFPLDNLPRQFVCKPRSRQLHGTVSPIDPNTRWKVSVFEANAHGGSGQLLGVTDVEANGSFQIIVPVDDQPLRLESAPMGATSAALVTVKAHDQLTSIHLHPLSTLHAALAEFSSRESGNLYQGIRYAQDSIQNHFALDALSNTQPKTINLKDRLLSAAALSDGERLDLLAQALARIASDDYKKSETPSQEFYLLISLLCEDIRADGFFDGRGFASQHLSTLHHQISSRTLREDLAARLLQILHEARSPTEYRIESRLSHDIKQMAFSISRHESSFLKNSPLPIEDENPTFDSCVAEGANERQFPTGKAIRGIVRFTCHFNTKRPIDNIEAHINPADGKILYEKNPQSNFDLSPDIEDLVDTPPTKDKSTDRIVFFVQTNGPDFSSTPRRELKFTLFATDIIGTRIAQDLSYAVDNTPPVIECLQCEDTEPGSSSRRLWTNREMKASAKIRVRGKRLKPLHLAEYYAGKFQLTRVAREKNTAGNDGLEEQTDADEDQDELYLLSGRLLDNKPSKEIAIVGVDDAGNEATLWLDVKAAKQGPRWPALFFSLSNHNHFDGQKHANFAYSNFFRVGAGVHPISAYINRFDIALRNDFPSPESPPLPELHVQLETSSDDPPIALLEYRSIACVDTSCQSVVPGLSTSWSVIPRIEKSSDTFQLPICYQTLLPPSLETKDDLAAELHRFQPFLSAGSPPHFRIEFRATDRPGNQSFQHINLAILLAAPPANYSVRLKRPLRDGYNTYRNMENLHVSDAEIIEADIDWPIVQSPISSATFDQPVNVTLSSPSGLSAINVGSAILAKKTIYNDKWQPYSHEQKRVVRCEEEISRSPDNVDKKYGQIWRRVVNGKAEDVCGFIAQKYDNERMQRIPWSLLHFNFHDDTAVFHSPLETLYAPIQPGRTTSLTLRVRKGFRHKHVDYEEGKFHKEEAPIPFRWLTAKDLELFTFVHNWRTVRKVHVAAEAIDLRSIVRMEFEKDTPWRLPANFFELEKPASLNSMVHPLDARF